MEEEVKCKDMMYRMEYLMGQGLPEKSGVALLITETSFSYVRLHPIRINATRKMQNRSEIPDSSNNKEENKMKQYIGTKRVQAEPAVRITDPMGNRRVVPLSQHPITSPADKVDMGYKVVYEDGYESWSPLDVFDRAYRQTDGLSFGLAIEAAKMGMKIARAGWNGKNQYVELATCISYVRNDGGIINAHHDAIGNKALAFVGTSGVQMGWLASQADMLADDWCIVE